MEEDNLLTGRRQSRSPTRRICLAFLFAVVSIVFIFLLLIAILSPILWSKYNTSIAQNSLNAANFQFEALTLSNPTVDTLTLLSNITISQAGSQSATLGQTELEVYSEGKLLGSLALSSQELKGDNEPTNFLQESTLKIKNNEVFKESTKALLSGETIQWRLRGPVRITVKLGLSLSFDLVLDKLVSIPGKALQDIRAYDLNVLQGFSDRIVVSQTQSLFNPSIISITNLGDLTFDILLPDPTLTTKKSNNNNNSGRLRTGRKSDVGRHAQTHSLKQDSGYTRVAELFISNFSSPQGLLIINATAIAYKGDNTTNQALYTFFSTWASGTDQVVRLRGPTNSSTGAAFLYGILDTEAIVVGNPDHVLIREAVFGENELTARQLGYNPLDVSVTQSDLYFDVNILPSAGIPKGVGIAYTIAAVNNHTCISSTYLGRLTLDTSNPRVTLGPKQVLNITVTADPDYLGYCDGYRIVATCCALAASSGSWPVSFNAVISGTMSSQVGLFQLTQQYSQALEIGCSENLISYCEGFVSQYCLLAVGDTCLAS